MEEARFGRAGLLEGVGRAGAEISWRAVPSRLGPVAGEQWWWGCGAAM